VAIEAAELIGGALGGALVTSVLQPLISQRTDRRNRRATVLDQLATVEEARWASQELSSDVARSRFETAVRNLRAAALVAGARRSVVDRYIILAAVAMQAAEQSLEESGGAEAAGIPSGLAELVRNAARIVVDNQWHPYRTALSVGRRLKASEQAERSLRSAASSSVERLNWSPVGIY
jgi:hypothetical protein